MSKLDELIAELCPDGVEYKPLSEIATITRGGNLQKKDFTESGVPCIHYGQIYTKYGLFTDRTYTFVSESTASKQKKAVPGDIVMAVTSENIEDVCKCVVWLGDEDIAVSGHTAIIHHTESAKSIIGLQQHYTDILNKQDRSNGNYITLLSHLFEVPMVSKKDVSKLLNVSTGTAGAIVDTFCELGILQDATPEKQRYKQYLFGEYFEILRRGTDL